MANEHHIEVRRTARYYVLGEIGEETRDIWFVCHGYAQLARDFIDEFKFHSAESKVGASWMTREDRECEISDYVVYLDSLYEEIVSKVDPSQVSVTALG